MESQMGSLLSVYSPIHNQYTAAGLKFIGNLEVVPSVYTDVKGHNIQSNQFSVTEHFKGASTGRLPTLPGVFFFYELSPIKVTVTEEHVSFLHFLTNVCAIIGGVFSVSGILDSFIYHGQRAIRKKIEIGKLN